MASVRSIRTGRVGIEVKRLTDRLTPLIRQLRGRYDKLERREKVLVQVAGGLVGVFLAYNLVYVPALNMRDSLHSSVEAREREVITVQKMTDRVRGLSAELAVLEKKTVLPSKDFSLFSVIEKTLGQSVGRDKIGSITPADRKISNELTEFTVELKLTGLSLQQLVDALYGIKTLQVPVLVSSMNIKKRFQDPHTYDVDMTCFTLGKNG